MNLRQQELIGVVLEYVNKARVAMGMDEILDLPLGEVNEPTQCPLANALSNDFIHATVLEHTIEFTYYNFQGSVLNVLREVWNTAFDDEGSTLMLPDPLSEFVVMFDDQKFPDYITPDPEDEEEGEDEEDEGEDEDINP